MTDDKLIAEIARRHEIDGPDRGGFWTRGPLSYHEDRAALLAIVRRQREREAALRESLLETAEELAVALTRLGVGGEGDGQERRADTDSWGGTGVLTRARKALAAGGNDE